MRLVTFVVLASLSASAHSAISGYTRDQSYRNPQNPTAYWYRAKCVTHNTNPYDYLHYERLVMLCQFKSGATLKYEEAKSSYFPAYPYSYGYHQLTSTHEPGACPEGVPMWTVGGFYGRDRRGLGTDETVTLPTTQLDWGCYC
jgi:hypothetical protein